MSYIFISYKLYLINFINETGIHIHLVKMIKIPDEINLENYTLILPSVAVGNVGQLCIDLLISSLDMYKIGSLWNSMFLPICGLDPYNKNSTSLCTTADFYLGRCHNIILLQLRSPYVGSSNDFFNELAQFIQRKKISKVQQCNAYILILQMSNHLIVMLI